MCRRFCAWGMAPKRHRHRPPHLISPHAPAPLPSTPSPYGTEIRFTGVAGSSSISGYGGSKHWRVVGGQYILPSRTPTLTPAPSTTTPRPRLAPTPLAPMSVSPFPARSPGHLETTSVWCGVLVLSIPPTTTTWPTRAEQVCRETKWRCGPSLNFCEKQGTAEALAKFSRAFY